MLKQCVSVFEEEKECVSVSERDREREREREKVCVCDEDVGGNGKQGTLRQRIRREK